MFARFISRSSRVVEGELAQVAVWTAVNIVLGLVFLVLLNFDDRLAHAVGF